MTIDEIRELIHLVQKSGVAELEVQWGQDRVRIRSSPKNKEVVVSSVLPISVGASPVASTNAAPVGADAISSPPAAASREEEQDVVVKSPIVGTYYDAPAPGAATFVKIGDPVEPKQVLCIIESMKLMNEIEAEIHGTLVAKHVENGRPVEYGESLFTVRPL